MAVDAQRLNVPIPDPSSLTTEQLRREISALRDALETRLNAMDKATELLNENVTRVPTETDKQIAHLKELHDEKFSSIQTQFDERDVRTEQAAIATKIAVDAALSAQKESAAAQYAGLVAAINKSEAATTKQIDTILAQLTNSAKATDDKIASNAKAVDDKIASTAKSTDDKIAVINGRLDRGEGGETIHKSSQATMLVVAALGVSIFMAGYAIIRPGGSSPAIEVGETASRLKADAELLAKIDGMQRLLDQSNRIQRSP
jgi:uncharacterized coiled-coil protein SlyX